MPRTRFNNGVLGPRQTTSASAASGIFGLTDHQVLTGGGIFPRSALPFTTDQYFPYVPLLINADSTNGATNNTFLDSSQNNTTLTPFGTMSQGSFSPFGDNWSNYFDGTGDYLSTASNAAFQFGTGDFAMECWIYMAPGTTLTSYWRGFLSCAGEGVYTNGVTLYIGDGQAGSTVPGEIAVIIGTDTIRIFGGQDIRTLGWAHVAVTRAGTTLRLFVNGVQRTSTTNSSNINATSYGAQIGLSYLPQTNYFPGYISNVRVVKGTALYTANFTPSTTPLTAVSGTSLLTCQSNRFRDNSANNFAITVNGDVAVQRWSPFSPTANYSTSTIGGGLGKFVTNNYLSLPSTNFAFSTASFTVELWLYYIPSESAASYGAFFDNGSQGVFLSFGTAKTNLIFYSTVSGQGDVGGFAHGMAANTWNHLAFVRNGTTQTIYVNGASIGSYTGVSGTMSAQSATAVVGTYSLATASYPCGGYISNMRIVNGVAVYTGNFTPPTLPLTTSGATSAACYPSTTNVNTSFAAASTSFLLNGTNSNIVDQSAMNLLGTIGQAQVSTAQSKFGGSSMLFDGTGDYLQMPPSDLLATWFNSDYTIEYWVYPNAFASSANGGSNVYSQSDPASTSEYFSFGPRASGVVVWYYYNGAVQIVTSGTISTGVWTHLAWTYQKASNTMRIFINGVLNTTTTISGTPSISTTANPILVGASTTVGFNGYIDDLRVTTGIARYTSTFTPPTSAFVLR